MPSGRKPRSTYSRKTRARVALGQPLVARAHHDRQVAETGHTGADAQLVQGFVERDLPRRARQQVLATQDVGDLHHRVVNGVDQRVERVTAGAQQREVGHVLRHEGDLAADQIGERDRLVGDPEPKRWPAAISLEHVELALGQLAAEPVVPRQLGAGRSPAGLDLVVRAVAVVGLARLAEPGCHVGVDVEALGLLVRRERSADLGPLVPVDAQPAQRSEDRVVAGLRVASQVGVLDPQHEGAAEMACESPVEQRAAHVADV